jgi:outer membrane receptor protein involved in Fe transport
MLWVFPLITLLVAASLHAQTSTATLSGTVHDSSSAVLAKAAVTLTNSGTGVSRKSETDGQGRYSFTGVEPGRYELSVEHPGFRKAVEKEVVLTVGGSAALDVTLQVGAVTESVTVTAAPPLIEVSSANLSRVVDEQTIESLPNLGRNFVDFTELSTGVAPGRENVGGGAFKEPDTGVGQAAAPRLSFGGQPELDTMILVDGAQNVQTFTGLPRVTPSTEAAQEFRILNSTYLSEYGRASGGFVNIVTKSGTNDYHGSGYFFGMNQALNEPYQLNPADPRLQQNQYGATFGGPVVKDRTFFFTNYEGQRRAQTNQYSSVVLNNIAAINAAKATLGLTPEDLGLLHSNDYDGFLGKIDHKLTNDNTLSVRYNLLHSIADGFLGGNGRGSPAPSTARNNTVLDQSVVASDIAMLRPNLVNESRFSFGRRTFNFPSAANDPDLEVPDLLLTGKSTSDVDFYRENLLEASDSLSYMRGAHQFKFGTGINYFFDTYEWNLFFPARALFSNFACFLGQEPACADSFGAPQSIAPFNNGLPVPIQFWTPILQGATGYPGVTVNNSARRHVFTQNVPSSWLPQTFSAINHGAYGFFAQDEWKVNSRLNLTYGLRYDFESYPSNYIVSEPHNGWQPRLGFAYSPAKGTVVRGGFGIFDGALVSSVGQNLVTGQWDGEGTLPNAAALAQQFGYSGLAPLQGRFPIAIQPPILGLTTPQASLAQFVATGQAPCLLPLGVFLSPPGPPNFGNCAPGTPPVAFPAFAIGPDNNLKVPYTEQASLKISQEIGGGFAVSASYLYVHAVHQGAVSGNLNATPIGSVDGSKACYGVAIVGGACSEPTNSIFPNLGTLFYVIDSGGMSVYNGGTLEIEKRFSRGFSLHGSYTFSRTISNYESVANLADLPQAQDRNLERAVSRQTVPQRFTFDVVSQVPRTVPLLHDFKFSTLIDAQSGQFYNIFAGIDANGDTNSLNDRPGALGRNTLKGPGIFSWDMRVGRDVRFNERLRGELTLDLFNVTNRVNVSDLNTVCECDLPASSFGPAALKGTIGSLNPLFGFDTARETLNPFQVQYGFKLRF